MRYLKSCIVFEADDVGTDDIKEVSPDMDLEKDTQNVRKDSLKKISSDLKEFIQKRQVIDDIFKKATDDKNLRQDLQNKVYKNITPTHQNIWMYKKK
jgi:hypothetical protein